MDYAQQIIQCYQHLSSSTNVEQASKIIMDFYEKRKAFPVLISILNSDNSETIKQYAAVGLQTILKNRWEDSTEKEEFLKPIFFLLMTNNSILVSKHLIETIAYLTDETVCEMVVSFASQVVNDEGANDPSFNYPMAIYTALCLLDKCIDNIGIDDSTMPLYQKIISDGFEINEIPIQIAAISYTFHLTYVCKDDLGFGPVFPQSLALMQSLSGEQQILDLFNVFSNVIYHQCPLINPHLLIPQLLNIINSEDSPFSERTNAFNLLINVLDNYSDEIFPSEDQSSDKANNDIISNSINDYASYIFDATLSIISAIFQEDESYSMSPYYLIEPIAEHFSDFEDLLESFWDQIPELQQYPFGQFFIIVFIRYSIDNDYEFYLPKIADIASFLCSAASESQSSCIVEAAIFALCSFAITFTTDITDLSSDIQDTVFEVVMNEPSQEMISSFEELIRSIGDSDCIFVKSCEFFSNIIASDQVGSQTKEQVLWCMSELIKNSEKLVEPLFQDLFGLLKEIFEMDVKSEDGINGIKSASVYCLSHLCSKCPALFEPFAEDFAKYIASTLADVMTVIADEQPDEEAEMSIDGFYVTQLINAYWYIVENLQESASSTIEEMIGMLIQICDKSDSNIPDFASIQEISLRVLCGCASKYPLIIQSTIQQLLGFISSEISYPAAIGANLISSAINSLPNRTEVLPQLIGILLDMIDKSSDMHITSKCLESLSFLIEWCGNAAVDEQILQTAGKAFTYELFCFNRDNEKYNEGVHQNAQTLFRHTINALQDTAYQNFQNTEFQTPRNIEIQNYIDLFITIADSKSKSMRDLGLQLLAELVGETPDGQIPNTLLEHILDLAEREASKGNYIGFFAIKKLSCVSPFNISYAEAFKSFIPMMVQRLFLNSEYAPEMDPTHSKESTMIANDNCVSALGAILINIFGDSLIEFFNIFEFDESNPIVEGLNVPIILVILSAMPPQIDISENESIMEFFLWLFEKAEGNFVEQFAAVLVKLFSDPIEVLKENLLTDGAIQRLNQILVQLIPSCGGVQFCNSVLNEDEEKLMILNSYLVSQ